MRFIRSLYHYSTILDFTVIKTEIFTQHSLPGVLKNLSTTVMFSKLKKRQFLLTYFNIYN